MKCSSPLYVVIATAGRPALLARTLRGLAACPKPASYAGTLVVENGPPGGVRELVACFSPRHQFHYVHSPPANKSRALNRAVALVHPALVVFTDDDVLPLPETLRAYAEAAEGRREGQFYGGPILPDYESSPPPDWLRPLLPRSVAGWQMSTTRPQPIYQPAFIGPNMAAFTSDVIRIGGFDERLGPGPQMLSPGEDTDVQARLLAGGVPGFYLPRAGMRHWVRAGNVTLRFACQRAERNGIYWGIALRRQRGFFPARYLKAWGQWLNDCWRIARWQRGGELRRQARARWLEARWRGRWQGLRLGADWPLPRWPGQEGPSEESFAWLPRGEPSLPPPHPVF